MFNLKRKRPKFSITRLIEKLSTEAPLKSVYKHINTYQKKHKGKKIKNKESLRPENQSKTQLRGGGTLLGGVVFFLLLLPFFILFLYISYEARPIFPVDFKILSKFY